jgi:hypothetical protein
MKGGVLVVFVLCMTVAFAVNPQLDALWGRYWSDCRPWGAANSGLSAKHFDAIFNNGYMSRISLYVNNPTCSGVRGVLSFPVSDCVLPY